MICVSEPAFWSYWLNTFILLNQDITMGLKGASLSYDSNLLQELKNRFLYQLLPPKENILNICLEVKFILKKEK